MNRTDLKKQNIFQVVLATVLIIAICYIGSYAYFRIDLTQEKRYTLSDVSVDVLKGIDGQILIKVYLDGNIPFGFKRLSQSVRELLDEFRVYAGNTVQYQFIDPYETPNAKATNAFLSELDSKGIKPINVKIKDDKGGYSERMVIPGAVVAYDGVELPVSFLVNNQGVSGEENLNSSIQNLEYIFINAIKSLTNKSLEKIAFLEGHGELNQYQVNDITRELSAYFQIDRGAINGNVHALDAYKCLIVAKPQTPFSEEDKYVLDQYLMRGGKILWFIDGCAVNTDSLAKGATMVNAASLNIDDQLFRYGIRINPVLVEDTQCGLLPVSVPDKSQKSKFIPAPWLYFPLLQGSAYHAISRNITPVKCNYPSYIDTLATLGTYKTILLQTSKLSAIRNTPALLSLAEIRQQHARSDFDKAYLPVAVLVEGQFTSVFLHRIIEGLAIKGTAPFLERSKPTQMLVVANGDVIRNDVRETSNGIMISPLGYDKISAATFGNKEFVLNAVNYLTDAHGLLKLRTKNVKLRLLNKEALQANLLQWQFVNVVLPVLLVLITGLVVAYLRKRKYS